MYLKLSRTLPVLVSDMMEDIDDILYVGVQKEVIVHQSIVPCGAVIMTLAIQVKTTSLLSPARCSSAKVRSSPVG